MRNRSYQIILQRMGEDLLDDLKFRLQCLVDIGYSCVSVYHLRDITLKKRSLKIPRIIALGNGLDHDHDLGITYC